MCPGRLKGCGRGLYGLPTWDSPRHPGNRATPVAQIEEPQAARKPVAVTEPQSQQKPAEESAPEKDTSKKIIVPVGPRKMKAKHTYKANKETPLGKELTVTPLEWLTFLEAHPDNICWWLAKNSEGEIGYVPATYMVVEELPTSLPWLANRKLEEEPPADNNDFGAPKGPYKPYKSAYDHKELSVKKEREHYCGLCEKQLNGPIPYSMHLKSKAHKEEEEIRQQMQS